MDHDDEQPDSPESEYHEPKAADAGPLDDPWAALTDSLGIEAAPEPEPPAPAPAPEPPPAAKHQLPTRPPSGWGDLASDFGLEEEPEEEPALASVESKPEPETGAHHVASLEPTNVVDESEAIHSEVIDDDEQVDPELMEVGFGEEVVEVAYEVVVEQVDVEIEEPAEGDVAAPEPSVPSGFGGSGLALPDWFPFGGRKKVPEPESEPVVEHADELKEVTEEVISESVEETADTEEDSDATDRPRGRRRRGRRRGRGRKKDEADVDAESDEVPVASGDVETDSAKDAPAGKRTRTVSHKNIPAWQEAIGVVVDANIAARGERKRNSRGRDNSRGGRGRRRGGGKKES